MNVLTQGDGAAGPLRENVNVAGWPGLESPASAELVQKDGEEWVVVDFGSGPPRFEQNTDGLLDRLRRLHDAAPSRILAFAKKYSILETPDGRWRSFSPSGRWGRWGVPVTLMREYAGLLDATLRLHQCLLSQPATRVRIEPADVQTVRRFLRRYTPLEPANWHPYVETDVPPPGRQEGDQWRRFQLHRVENAVNWWLDRVHPALSFRRDRFVLRWRGGLWGALGGQLVQAIQRETNSTVCDYCRREFVLSRRPRRNARTRCCGRAACQRAYHNDRMHAWRERERNRAAQSSRNSGN